MSKPFFSLAMMALALVGCTGMPVQTPTPTPVTATYEVSANAVWQDTGLQVDAGDLVAIQYSSGSWTTWSGFHSLVDGDGNASLGDPKNPNHPVPGAFPGVLIAKIGEGFPREIGNRKEFRSCDTGTLFLQMNDDILSDNEGRILVQISVNAPTDHVACDPVETPAPVSEPPAPPPPTPDLSGAPDLSSLIDVRTITSISPYGPWTAVALLVSLTDKDYARLSLHKVDERGSSGWRPYEEWSESGLGDSFLAEFYWSADGRFLYFTHKGVAHPCGFSFTTNLRRVDLEAGSLIDIPLTGIGLEDITISPGAEKLVYRTEEGLLVRELKSGSTRTLPFQWPQDYLSVVGPFAWSPDGSELGFAVTETLCGMPGELRSSLQIINLETGAVRAAKETDSWLYLTEKISTDPIATAVLALQDYLNSLYWDSHGGREGYTYEKASNLFGGSYETLLGMNPETDPDDHVALLRNACEVNGYQCMRLYDVISSQVGRPESDARMVYLTVRLMNPDGSVFALGSCCGDGTELPQTWFGFSVRQMEDGTWKVLDLPPYMP